MPRPIPTLFAVLTRRAALTLAVVAAAFVLATTLPTPASAQAKASSDGWTRRVTLDLSAADLGLRAGVPARDLARAALATRAEQLGLPRSLRGVRVTRQTHFRGAPGTDELLRFQQTVSGARVLWSQIDVAVTGGRVRSISATVVPVTGEPLAAAPKVSRERALQIARRAVPGPDRALQPLRVAYAGKPTTSADARERTSRLAWVVETTPASSMDAGMPIPVCIVVDAETGEVIGRWSGLADRPDRGPQARGMRSASADRPFVPSGPTARPAAANPLQFLLEMSDGSAAPPDRTDAFEGTTAYASFAIARDPQRNANWPAFLDAPPWIVSCTQRLAPLPCLNLLAPHNAAMDVIAANAENVARTVCVRHHFCGRLRGLQGDSGNYLPWDVIGRGTRTRTFPSSLAVEIAATDAMDGTCIGGCGQGAPLDPRQPFNDLVAHEFGHVMDLVYAGDRALGDLDLESQAVMEGLADMFAYDYDREDATLAEDAGRIRIRWDDPSSYCPFPGGVCFPKHMDDFDPTPPFGDVHFNGTILSHAYFLFVDVVGHEVAARVLQDVPAFLSPRPTFEEVSQVFCERSFGVEIRGPVVSAFNQVGLRSCVEL